MHTTLRRELPLDDVFTCFHNDKDACDCRKPKPGLVTRAAREYGIDLDRSFLTGDRWRDVDAGASDMVAIRGSVGIDLRKILDTQSMPLMIRC